VLRTQTPSQGPPLALLLPGASGLRIFDDDNHYFRAASRLNDLGCDCLIVDYKTTYRALSDRPDGEACEKIAWVVERLLTNDQLGFAGRRCVLVAWSLGGEGALEVLSDGERTRRLNITSAVFFYPSNECANAVHAGVPTLILTGSADDVVREQSVRDVVTRSGPTQPELVVYPGAAHGFDVESISTPRTARLLPLIGPSATFAHNPDATADAWLRIKSLLWSSPPSGGMIPVHK
jgi:dienelactone hydrolase